jgi:hypothetical protein
MPEMTKISKIRSNAGIQNNICGFINHYFAKEARFTAASPGWRFAPEIILLFC